MPAECALDVLKVEVHQVIDTQGHYSLSYILAISTEVYEKARPQLTNK